MAFEVLTVAPPADLRARFAAAAAQEPLSALPAHAARELTELLDAVAAFEDLPGRWQAALLEAEAARGGGQPPPRSCCGGA